MGKITKNEVIFSTFFELMKLATLARRYLNFDDSVLMIFPHCVLAYKAFEVLTTMVIT